MDQGPLVSEQIEAGGKLVSDFDKRIPLQAAFWLRETDDGQWFLHLVSDQIDDSNFRSAYREVGRALRNHSNICLTSLQVKVGGIDRPVAKAVLEIQQQYPQAVGTRLHERLLGGVSIDGMYIYPLPVRSPA